MENEIKKLIKHELFTIEDIIYMILNYKDEMVEIEDDMRYNDKILDECPNIVMKDEIIGSCTRMRKAIANIKDIMEEFDN